VWVWLGRRRSLTHALGGGPRRSGTGLQRPGGRAGLLWFAWCSLSSVVESEANINHQLIDVNCRFISCFVKVTAPNSFVGVAMTAMMLRTNVNRLSKGRSMTDGLDIRNQGLEGRECVPYFGTNKSQIIFEFFYLVALLVLAGLVLLAIQLRWVPVEHHDKVLLFSLLGGFLGGWVYDAKWFYRVTARGKSNQYNYLWQCHKFYWRVLTPFLSAIVAFVTYLLMASGVLPVALKGGESAGAAFSISFVFGYFSDLVLSRLAAWAEQYLPKLKKEPSES